VESMRNDQSLRSRANGRLQAKDAKTDTGAKVEAASPANVRTLSPINGDLLKSRSVALPFTRERKYQKGEAIFTQGDRADALYMIRSGRIKLTVASSGKTAVLRLVGSGGVFGEECLTSEHSRKATAVAIVPSIVARELKQSIVRTLRQRPALMGGLISHLLLRVESVEEELVDQILNSSEKRLAKALVSLADMKEGSIGTKSLPAVDQKTLAEMVGTTRSRVSYFMNRFRRLGLIEYNGNLQVHSALLSFLHHQE
jgi:CRP/FNR family transcriptional regulator, cyclic AMP receptor protein